MSKRQEHNKIRIVFTDLASTRVSPCSTQLETSDFKTATQSETIKKDSGVWLVWGGVGWGPTVGWGGIGVGWGVAEL